MANQRWLRLTAMLGVILVATALLTSTANAQACAKSEGSELCRGTSGTAPCSPPAGGRCYDRNAAGNPMACTCLATAPGTTATTQDGGEQAALVFVVLLTGWVIYRMRRRRA